MEKSKTITILLNQFDGALSHLVCFLSNSRYSHAAISLDDNHNEFYSFCYKGFTVEHPFFRKKRSEMLELIIPVTDEQYSIIKDEVDCFSRKKNEWKYSKLGFVLLLLRIPARFKHRLFCSQFVTDILSKAGAVELQMDSSLYFPGWLIDRLKYGSKPKLVLHAAM